MQHQLPEWQSLDASDALSISELASVCRMSTDELNELVGYGALTPVSDSRQQSVFSADCVVPLRKANQLRIDFDLDVFTVGLLIGYLRRIDGLERQLKVLEAHLPSHVIKERHEQPTSWREPHGCAMGQ